MIFNCTCKHKGQDEIHGPGMRVHTPRAKAQNKPQVYRCTVCQAEREENGQASPLRT